ncbi:uncharacterized protein [Watersipora subatra]|uniref:uncharacterized protein n=1 Tax=Watersipora subatra TaxID=2589382 RepID=UPI00355C9AEA
MLAARVCLSNIGVKLILLISLCTLVWAKESKPVKYPKSQQMDVLFPPDIDLPNSPGLPIGHLRPLGHQRRSVGEVTQGNSSSTVGREPLVFRNIFVSKEAESLWSNTGNAENLNSMESILVWVAQRQRSGATFYQKMTLSKFLDNYGSEEWILDEVLHKAALRNIKMPKGFECFSENLLQVSSSLTSGVTSDDIKTSTTNHLQCVVKGKRDYIILRNESAISSAESKHPQSICGTDATLDINADEVNVFDNPWIASTHWNHATLQSGDCILLPADTVFHTTSYGECKTLTFNWGNKTTCNKKEKTSNEQLEPFLCSNEDNRVQLCNCSSMKSVGRWQELLPSVINRDGFLTKSCLAHLTNSEEDSLNPLGIFNKGPILLEDIKKLSTATIKMIIEMACPTAAEHIHDEL